MSKLFLTNEDIASLAKKVAREITITVGPCPVKLYGVPRGGVSAAYIVMAYIDGATVVNLPEEADFIIDDIIDSGATRNQYKEAFFDTAFLALIDKNNPDTCSVEHKNAWIVFPWEVKADGQEEGVEENIRRSLQHIEPETYEREGLTETPARVAKAYSKWFEGYSMKASDILKTFEDGAQDCDEMVMVKDIPLYSKCEHHMADIFGTVTIAYIPSGKIVGLSKLSRLVNMYARRLQVQERLTNQIANAIVDHLEAQGVGVIVKARHMCMESRGICQQGHHTITSALRGAMKEQPETRSEFMLLAK
tara:strand:- start:829 stop:1746 length:918 start_codon:yes stop_codon:yes gene_type:complete